MDGGMKDWKSQVVALHPFKDRDSYLKCYNNAKEAGMYEWTVHADKDYPGKAGHGLVARVKERVDEWVGERMSGVGE